MENNKELNKKLSTLLQEFVKENNNLLTKLVIEIFNLRLTDMVTNQIENAIDYYAAKSANEIDKGINIRLCEVVQSSFQDTLEKRANEIIENRINSEKIDDMVDLIIGKKLSVQLQREIRMRVKDLIDSKDLKLSF